VPNNSQGDKNNLIWEIILRDFLGAILRTPTAAGMQMPECEHLNPHLFEPPTTQFTGPEKAQNNFQNHSFP
jgi:hypothetical protein